MEIVWGGFSKSHIRTAKGLFAVALFCTLGVLYVVPPDNLPFATCAFHSLTGYSCLTCGMTRSLHAILHGDLIASVKFHAMGPILFLLAILSMIVLSAEALAGKEVLIPWKTGSARKLIFTIMIFWLLYWGTRLISELAA